MWLFLSCRGASMFLPLLLSHICPCTVALPLSNPSLFWVLGVFCFATSSQDCLTLHLVFYIDLASGNISTTCDSHTRFLPGSLAQTDTRDRDINTSWDVLNVGLTVWCIFWELLGLQSGSKNAQWTGSCLGSSLAGSRAQRVCIPNAPLASKRELIGRINCGCRAEWE